MHSISSTARSQRIAALTSVMVALLVSLGILRWAFQGEGAGALVAVLEVELEDGLEEPVPEIPGLCLPATDSIASASSQLLGLSDPKALLIQGGRTCWLHPERAPPAV